MPTPPANRKVLHYFGYIYPILFIALGAAGLIVAAFARTVQGSLVVGLLGAAGVALGGFLAWRHSKHDATAPVTLDDYPLEEQPRQLRRYMWITGAATALLGAWIAYDLMRLESGAVRSVRIWFAIADIYESFGFWPAVLFVPALGALGLLALGWKLRSVRQRIQQPIRAQ
jgi:H+/gluconate symporter-like permease